MLCCRDIIDLMRETLLDDFAGGCAGVMSQQTGRSRGKQASCNIDFSS